MAVVNDGVALSDGVEIVNGREKLIMDTKGRYPESIIRFLRLRMGLDEDDTHLDEHFQSMSPSHVFSWVLEWNGLLVGWDFTIKGWIKDIYGIDLDAVENQK